MNLSHGQVCYLELPAADRHRAAAFYQAVFGWETGEHYPDFTSPGLIGQWVEGRLPARDAGPMIWLAVADMAGTLSLVNAHGGQVIAPPGPRRPRPGPRHDPRSGRQSRRTGCPRLI